MSTKDTRTKVTIGRRFSHHNDSSDSSDDDDELPVFTSSKPVIATPGTRFLKQKEEERRVQKEEEQKNEKRNFLKKLFKNVSQGSKEPITEIRGIYKKTKPLTKKWTKGGKRRDKRTRRDKRKGYDKRTMRGSGNCGSSGCLKNRKTDFRTNQNIENSRSSRKTLYTNNSQNMAEEESWDELIKALENETHEKEEKKEKNIVNQHVDWTAVIKAAEVANQNEKKIQELAANQQISNYKQRTQTRADQAIQRMFHRKTSKNRRRKTP